MSFKIENQYFIKNKLYAEMRGLGLIQRLVKYSIIKDEVRGRIENAYSTITDKISFYKELFEVLSDYESDYLFINLFFEDECADIVNGLNDSNTFHSDLQFSSMVFSGDFYHFIIGKNRIISSDIIEFVKKEFSYFIPDITPKDWQNDELRKYPIIHKFTDFLDKNLRTNNIDFSIYPFLLLVKIWNCFSAFSSPFNNLKAIVLYDYVIRIMNKNAETFEIFHNKLKMNFDNFLVADVYIPLLDNKDEVKYSSGYLKKRDEYHEKFNSILIIVNTNEKENYFELLKKIKDNPSSNLSEKCKSLIYKKLQAFCYPNDEELNQIRKLEFTNNELSEFRNDFFHKLYLFE